MTRSSDVRGLIPVLATPFHPNGDLDTASLHRLVEFQLQSFVDGVAVFGFASEGFALTAAERREILRVVTTAAGPELPVVAGVAATGTRDAVDQARAAADAGASVAMVVPPHMVKPSGPQLVDFYGTVAAEGGLPVMVQDAPASTGVNMPVPLIVELSKLDGVESVKVETQPTAPKIGAVVDATAPEFRTLGGQNALFVLEEYARGAVGTMPASEFPDLLLGALALWNADGRDRARDGVHQDPPVGTLRLAARHRLVHPQARTRPPGHHRLRDGPPTRHRRRPGYPPRPGVPDGRLRLDPVNRRVLLVGATSPIGLAIGHAFAAAGDRVVGVALEPAADKAFTAGLVYDCATSAGATAAVTAAAELLGGLDVLVPAAAVMPVAPATGTSDAQWHAALDTTLSGAFYLCRAALPLLGNGSAIVAVSSVNAFLAAPGVPAYAAAKAGLEGLVRQLALEYGPRGIRVNAVAPGMIGGAGIPDAAAGYPLGRVGEPDEVAQAVLFLAGAGFVTGVTLPVDGGLSIASPAAFLRDDLRARWL